MSKGGVREYEGIGRATSPSTSTAASTSRTPGAERAAAVSTARMRACAWGERTTTAWSCPASATSSVKHDAPVRKRGSSLRFRGAPILASSFMCVGSGRSRSPWFPG